MLFHNPLRLSVVCCVSQLVAEVMPALISLLMLALKLMDLLAANVSDESES